MIFSSEKRSERSFLSIKKLKRQLQSFATRLPQYEGSTSIAEIDQKTGLLVSTCQELVRSSMISTKKGCKKYPKIADAEECIQSPDTQKSNPFRDFYQFYDHFKQERKSKSVAGKEPNPQDHANFLSSKLETLNATDSKIARISSPLKLLKNN